MLCGEVLHAEGEHYADFTLGSEMYHTIVKIGVVRSTYDPTGLVSPNWQGVGSTLDGWMLAPTAYGGSGPTYQHGGVSKKWTSGEHLRLSQGDTIGLLLRAGQLSVYRHGTCAGVVCEGLSGPLVWAASLPNIGDTVRIARKPAPQ